MLKHTLMAATLAIAGIGCAAAHGDRPGDKKLTIKIIGFNDYHGNLESPGTFGVNTTVPAASGRRWAAPNTWPPTCSA